MLKQKIQEYFSTRDLSCDDDVDRKIVIQQTIEIYRRISSHMEEPDEYLSYMNNDIVKLIGYRMELEEKKDIDGIHLWKELDERMYEGETVIESKVIDVLLEVPLGFLMSFLGYAAYKERQWDIL